MFDIILKNPILSRLLSKHNEFIDLLIKNDNFNCVKDENNIKMFDECVNDLILLGLHYGHSVKHRKCENKFIKGTQYSVSLINMKISYLNFLYSIFILYKHLMSNKNVLFVTKKNFDFLNNCKFPNICSIKKWIGGTLTNSKFVLSSYGCKIYDSSYGYISLIYLLNVSDSSILSKEVVKYNENDKNKVNLYLISDTNMQFISNYSIVPILFNDESPYFKIFINNTMTKVLDLL